MQVVTNQGVFFPGGSSGGSSAVSRFTSLRCRKDNWVERVAIYRLSTTLQTTTGLVNQKRGYESLVEAAEMMYQKFHPAEQTRLVLTALHSLFPPLLLHLVKSVLPESRFSRELFASFTAIFFTWLVGPCQVEEQEGRGERSLVKVKKCRFLEQRSCVGMCIYLCKLPTQEFIKEKLGMPVTMLPDFEDLSCRIVFGESPPPPSEDPTLKHPCLNLCKGS